MQTYVRWSQATDRLSRLFPPMAAGHPGYAEPCLACGSQLGNGEPLQLVVLGPGDDDEARAKHHAGRSYSAVAWTFHAACLGTSLPADDTTV